MYFFYNLSVTGHEKDPPTVDILNSTDLVLGEINIFLCEVKFTEDRISSLFSAWWEIGGNVTERIHENPYCSTQDVRLKIK